MTMNLVIWGINIILQILPYLGGLTYGGELCQQGLGFGNLQMENMSDGESQFDTPEKLNNWLVYVGCCFYLPLILCLSGMVSCSCWLYFVTLPVIRLANSKAADKVYFCIQNASLYPAGMIVSWVPSLVTWVVTQSKMRTGGIEDVSYGLAVATNICFTWGNSYAWILTAVFFVRSADARRYWKAAWKSVVRHQDSGGLAGQDVAAKDIARRAASGTEPSTTLSTSGGESFRTELGISVNVEFEASLDDDKLHAAVMDVRRSLVPSLHAAAAGGNGDVEMFTTSTNPNAMTSKGDGVSSSNSNSLKQALPRRPSKRMSAIAISMMNLSVDSIEEGERPGGRSSVGDVI